ncbi:TetR/AcrR family transcriptional regulator, transcriptional repressor for nem operon [Amycolatopsis arida]|uniref:TetR/AcrR family transcriptional regulator, transcriptional repressor for nem operon n=1 Tax=Amycolatopsis arida TaxID=587909 RepID=A0A1I5XMG7_9PSEU|nr:TetR/AcrR family transcriptional regulator [Amycolatopsis arida]TDX97361.1 TetR/AcrR family transcriptional repressor of nem operon [Amycolatopsis arida]SFQ33124.1 TetR/AcrR family transcriptional regulator, transcriptional repressor for nem operon [Amycolatopsis arida]
MGRTSDARERIVRAAARLFLTASYESVGVEDVCLAADVRKGSFYHYFRSKADLALAVIDFHATALDERMTRAATTPDPAAALVAVARTIGEIQTGFELRFGHVVGCPFGNLAAELSTADDAVRIRLARVFTDWRRQIALACHRAAGHGLLRPGTDPERLARALLAQAQGAILLAKVDGSPARDIADALHDLIAAHLSQGRNSGRNSGLNEGAPT